MSTRALRKREYVFGFIKFIDEPMDFKENLIRCLHEFC